MTEDIILASQSPRRAQLLTTLKVPFRIVPSNFNEESIPYHSHPTRYVCEIAEQKALAIAAQNPKSTVIAADSVVFLEDRPFGKPPTRQDAVDYLSQLCGKWHSVITGVSVIKDGRHEQLAEETHVLFNPLTHDQINAYLNAITWHDKAGAYAIQGDGGALLVSQIRGCFYNVMGLPINSLQVLMERFGLSLWNYFSAHKD